MNKLYVWQMVAILLIGIILGYAGARVELVLTEDTNGQAAVVVEPTAPTPEAPAPVVLNDEQQEKLIDEDGSDPVLGEEDAPVTIVEFSDYQCPFCGRYSTETFEQIKTNFIDTGKVKYYFRDFPLSFHPQAEATGKAATCAGEQGKYWEMHDVLFAKQSEWSGSPEVVQLIATYAQELGLDTDKLETCMGSEATAKEMINDFAIGQELGVTGTPAFFINGKKFVGAQPYASFESAINSVLND